MGLFNRTSEPASRMPVVESAVSEPRIVRECFCAKGHSLVSNLASFGGHPGITLRLKNERQEGLLALSPVIGDKRRTFFNFERVPGEIVQICCPTCSEPLPVYNVCTCGANLVAIFTTLKTEFASCIGICQRIGCLHSEIKSNRDLRLFSRNGYFD
ncbi:MAG: hypothetical protein A2X84_05690 [Desulfuromonadaceae bacterium GWC2_58_13]|nr:MAG: hypothetical protein A2X84_05690 [Desulfuromonadaceae bacterium GWC2_58_13]